MQSSDDSWVEELDSLILPRKVCWTSFQSAGVGAGDGPLLEEGGDPNLCIKSENETPTTAIATIDMNIPMNIEALPDLGTELLLIVFVKTLQHACHLVE